MNATEIAAWWGAGIATLLLVWDIYKWLKSGPIISYTVSSNMKVFDGIEEDDKTFISVRVSNSGDRTTTITHMAFSFYNSFFHKLIRKSKSNIIISLPGRPNQLPFELKPGGIWDGAAIQDDNIEKMSIDGYLECHIYYSDSEKPVRRKVKVRKINVS